MNDSTSKKATSYFKANSRELDLILVKLKELDELNASVIKYLDPNIQKYCQVANLVNGQLIITVANGSIATLLRFQAPDLINKFKRDAHLKKIVEIRCKVQSPSKSNPQVKSPHPMALLSAETAQMIHEAAAALSDPRLRDAMNKIAKHVKK